MGSISERKRADGTIAYKAEIVVRKDGKRLKLSQTFVREAADRHWMKRREEELRKPGGLAKLEKTRVVTLAQAIERYITELTQIGRTEAQVLQALLLHDVAHKECSDIGSKHLVDLARDLSLDRKPQTMANYMSHLSAVVAIAKPAWGYDLNQTAMQEALVVCKRLRLTVKSSKRDRRPTVEEMERLMTHFADRTQRRGALRMAAFALISATGRNHMASLG